MQEQLLLNVNKSIIEMEICSFKSLGEIDSHEIIQLFKSSFELTITALEETLGETTGRHQLFEFAYISGIIENCDSWVMALVDYRLLPTYVDTPTLMTRIFANHIHTLKSVLANIQVYSYSCQKIA